MTFSCGFSTSADRLKCSDHLPSGRDAQACGSVDRRRLARSNARPGFAGPQQVHAAIDEVVSALQAIIQSGEVATARGAADREIGCVLSRQVRNAPRRPPGRPGRG